MDGAFGSHSFLLVSEHDFLHLRVRYCFDFFPHSWHFVSKLFSDIGKIDSLSFVLLVEVSFFHFFMTSLEWNFRFSS